MVVGGCRSLVAEHWRLKPEALGSIPSGTTFLSFPLLFQRSTDSKAQIISIGLQTGVSTVYQAPYAVISSSDSFVVIYIYSSSSN